MEQEMYRTAYMVMISYSEEFGKKEYYNKILKFLDIESEKFFKMSFINLTKTISEFDTDNLNEIEAQLSYMRSDEYTKQKRLLKAKGMRGGELYRALSTIK